jgi:hypothetical protein
MLEIRRNGKLIETYWHYDKQVKQGEHRERDVTSSAIRRLFEPCQLEEGILLKDVLMLLDSNLLVFDAVLGNWCQALVEEGLRGQTPSKAENQVEYLELYWHWQLDNDNENSLHGYEFPQLHGVGFKHDYDQIDSYGNLTCKAGERINYAVEMSSVNELAVIPIRLRHAISITSWDPENPETKITDNGSFTLGHILYGILWELSFFGSPEMRNNTRAEIDRRVQEIKDDDTNLVPWNEACDEPDSDIGPSKP